MFGRKEKPSSSAASDAESSPEWEMIKQGKNPNLPPNHPVNALSPWRKEALLWTLAYAGALANFGIAIVMVAFPESGADLGVSPGKMASSIGYAILGQGVGSLLWNPLARSIGRRPTYLIACVIYIPFVAWTGQAKTYLSWCLARTFTGLTAAWTQTLPPTSIADVFVVEVRGAKMATYSIPNLIAPVIAPFFGALIVNKSSWRNQFWLNFGLAVLQLVLVYFFVPETMWNETTAEPTTVEEVTEADKRDVATFETAVAPVSARPGYVGPAFMPWRRPGEFLRMAISPILTMRYINILLVAFYGGLCFGFLSLGVTIPVPQILIEPPYNFKVIPLGCAYLAFGIGGLLGKWSGGLVGDKVSAWFERKNGQRQPEDRLWAVYPVLPLTFLGVFMVGCSLHWHTHWILNLVGGAVAFFALTALTNLQTYCMESYLSRSMDTMWQWNFWKCMWGFAVPFFIMNWGESWGWLETCSTEGALMAGIGALLCMFLIWKGYDLRKAQGMPIMEKN